jgi:hypothetical protein
MYQFKDLMGSGENNGGHRKCLVTPDNRHSVFSSVYGHRRSKRAGQLANVTNYIKLAVIKSRMAIRKAVFIANQPAYDVAMKVRNEIIDLLVNSEKYWIKPINTPRRRKARISADMGVKRMNTSASYTYRHNRSYASNHVSYRASYDQTRGPKIATTAFYYVCDGSAFCHCTLCYDHVLNVDIYPYHIISTITRVYENVRPYTGWIRYATSVDVAKWLSLKKRGLHYLDSYVVLEIEAQDEDILVARVVASCIENSYNGGGRAVFHKPTGRKHWWKFWEKPDNGTVWRLKRWLPFDSEAADSVLRYENMSKKGEVS